MNALLSAPPPRLLRYGAPICKLKRSPRDPRDYRLDAVNVTTSALEGPFPSVPVMDQGASSACASFATVAGLQIIGGMTSVLWDDVQLSPRYHYREARILAGDYPLDSGQTLRDAMRAAKECGVAPEKLCPTSYESLNELPGLASIGFAGLWKLKAYRRCWSYEDVLAAISARLPVVIAYRAAYEFLGYRGGIVKPNPTGARVMGGHAMLVLRADEKMLRVQNSWGLAWGLSGKCWLSREAYDADVFEAWAMDWRESV